MLVLSLYNVRGSVTLSFRNVVDLVQFGTSLELAIDIGSP